MTYIETISNWFLLEVRVADVRETGYESKLIINSQTNVEKKQPSF